MSTTGTGTDGLVERLTAFLDGLDSLESRGDVVDRIVVTSGTHVLSASDLRQLLAEVERLEVIMAPRAARVHTRKRVAFVMVGAIGAAGCVFGALMSWAVAGHGSRVAR